MTGGDSAAWIDDGEKYALVGLNVKFEGRLPAGRITPNLWVLAAPNFKLPSHWQEWLGSIRAQEVEDCNLFLLSKVNSSTPGVLDAENQKLQQRAWNFYIGPFAGKYLCDRAQAGDAYRIAARWRDRYPSAAGFYSPISCVFRPYPPLVPGDIRLAAQVGENLDTLATAPLSGGHWRLFRTLHIYTEARTKRDILDRLHQYCGCIDGLILPNAGETRRQFKSRTELFIGPRHHDLMGELYDIRSAVEHLHENRYLESRNRPTRLDLLKKEAIVEYVARKVLARILDDAALWSHFASTSALAIFWALAPRERQNIWGDPFDLLAAIADFDPKYIHYGLLGLP